MGGWSYAMDRGSAYTAPIVTDVSPHPEELQ
jgi:hypothetical protein